jgi:hypothetical protein
VVWEFAINKNNRKTRGTGKDHTSKVRHEKQAGL